MTTPSGGVSQPRTSPSVTASDTPHIQRTAVRELRVTPDASAGETPVFPVPEPAHDVWTPSADTMPTVTYPPDPRPRQMEARFTVDDHTHQTVVGIYDRDTGELVREVPPESVRRLAESLARAASGHKVDTSA